jgi:hypothetical protein
MDKTTAPQDYKPVKVTWRNKYEMLMAMETYLEECKKQHAEYDWQEGDSIVIWKNTHGTQIPRRGVISVKFKRANDSPTTAIHAVKLFGEVQDEIIFVSPITTSRLLAIMEDNIFAYTRNPQQTPLPRHQVTTTSVVVPAPNKPQQPPSSPMMAKPHPVISRHEFLRKLDGINDQPVKKRLRRN